VLSAIIAGGAMYYLQVYAFYEEISASGENDVQLVSLVSGEPEPILFDQFEAIDAYTSPIRYRACFTTVMSHSLLSETYVAFENAEPRNAPGWFECFDAEAIGAGGNGSYILGAKEHRLWRGPRCRDYRRRSRIRLARAQRLRRESL
jgi:hypothetical protein